MSASDVAFTGSVPELYDRCLGPMLFEPFALELAERFRGFEGRILETAAGTGRVTRALAEAAPGAAIVATDLNDAMIARAAEVVSAPNVEWRQADAQALPFEDAGFDAVVCQFGVMFFPDKAAGYAEARRVLRPGGRHVFSVWDAMEANEISQAAHDALGAAFPDDPPQFLARMPFGYHDQDAIRAGLAAAGFGRVEIDTVRRETRCDSVADAVMGLCQGSPMHAEIEASHPGQMDRAVAAVTRALSERFGEGPVTGQGQALVVTAT